MRAPRCALLLLLQCVSALPVSHTDLDNNDVKVTKCIVEVLADALSKPQSLPVSQECLETLRTDDRLVTVLRHQNFLQELQDIAGEGANERSEKATEEHPDAAQDLQEPADQSMLMAFLTPGETTKERRDEEEEEEEEKEEPQENGINTSREDVNEGDEKGEQAVMKKTENSDEDEEDDAGAAGRPEHKRMEQKKEEEEEEEEESVGKQKHWSQSRESVHPRTYGQQEAPHHSKEVWKSPEEELKMMAGKDPEEGSATKRTEDAEMETLAVMESELENMAQKLHQLRHG